MTVLEEIRRATSGRHAELESGSRIIERLLCVNGRREVLCAFYALHAAAELALLPWLTDVVDLDYQQRLKLPRLRDDLRALGVSDAELPRLPASVPTIGDRAEALGFAYVLEGATLGGRVIRKRLAEADPSVVGAGFFDVYGRSTGDRWKQFCGVLDRECSAQRPQAVRGACAGFDFAHARLLPSVQHSSNGGDCP